MEVRLRKLTAADAPALAETLTGQAVHHILLLGRLAKLGRDPQVAFWGLAGHGGFQAVLSLEDMDWALANPGGADLYPFAQVIEAHGPGRLRAEAGVAGGLARHLRERVEAERGCLLVRLAPGNLPPAEPGPAGRRLTPEEAAIWPSWLPTVRDPVRVVAVFAGDEPVAAAWTEVEAQGLAMIGGVGTAPAHRGRGLGSACLWTIARDLLAGGLLPQLVYDCPVIGRLVGRLGFTPYGRWRELTLRGEARSLPNGG